MKDQVSNCAQRLWKCDKSHGSADGSYYTIGSLISRDSQLMRDTGNIHLGNIISCTQAIPGINV